MFGKGWDREIDLLTTKEKIKIQNANPARAGQNDTCQGRQSSKFLQVGLPFWIDHAHFDFCPAIGEDPYFTNGSPLNI